AQDPPTARHGTSRGEKADPSRPVAVCVFRGTSPHLLCGSAGSPLFTTVRHFTPLSPTVNHPAPCLRRRRPTHDPPATRESTGNPQVRALRQEREPSGAEWSADHAAGTPTEHNAHRTTPAEHGAGGPIGRRKWSHLRNPAMLGRRRSEPSSSKAPLAGGTSDLRS